MRRVVVGKGAQGFLLFAYTALVLAGTLLVEGRPGVVTNLVPFDDLARLRASAGRRASCRTVSSSVSSASWETS
ncbi:hypothetical protein LDC_2002 [sediment metagenome]|uniref:Uncharacterized protein n=1 Tax=sediment metagenome TaxID=749907 RepID=D9PKD7_9ZZZZ